MHNWLIRKIALIVPNSFKRRDLYEQSDYQSEMQSLIDDVVCFKPDVPDFNPRCTALFTSISYKLTLAYHLRASFYRKKVRNDCMWLINHGYYDMIVSYGNPYGMLALQELSKLRKEGLQFMLHGGKVSGERQTLIRNGLEVIYLIDSCDNWVGSLDFDDFIDKVVYKVTIISSTEMLIKSQQKIPRCLYTYYTKLLNKGDLTCIG